MTEWIGSDVRSTIAEGVWSNRATAPAVPRGSWLAVARALLDVWHADDRGGYDTAGFRLRGHQFTDGSGRFELETIVPGLYPGRTRHIHVKVQAPNGPILTTQL